MPRIFGARYNPFMYVRHANWNHYPVSLWIIPFKQHCDPLIHQIIQHAMKRLDTLQPFRWWSGILWQSANNIAAVVDLSAADVKPSTAMQHSDVIMGEMASQITSLTIVYSTVYSGADQRKHQSFASLAFVRGIHRCPINSPHKGLVTRKRFSFDDVIMDTD